MNYTIDSGFVTSATKQLHKFVPVPAYMIGAHFSDPERTVTGATLVSKQQFLSNASEKLKNIFSQLTASHGLTGQLPIGVVHVRSSVSDITLELDAQSVCVDQMVFFIDADINVNIHLVIRAAELSYVTIHIVALRNTHVGLVFESYAPLWSRLNIITHLREPDAQMFVKGLYLGSSEAVFSCMTQQLHCADRTESSVIVKSLLAGSSRFVYKGLIDVEKNCNQIKAVQVNRNSLLSPSARSISIPTLQVQSKGVSCTHASATGPFDKELLWYVQSRGIDFNKARELMMKAFVADVVPVDRVDHIVQDYIAKIQ